MWKFFFELYTLRQGVSSKKSYFAAFSWIGELSEFAKLTKSRHTAMIH